MKTDPDIAQIDSAYQQAEIDRLKAELAKKTTHPKATVFLLDKMPWEKEFTIRIHVPGIHCGAAFASDCEAGKTKEEAEALLSSVSLALGIPARC